MMKNLIILAVMLFSLAGLAQDPAEKPNDLSNEEMASLQAKRLAMQLDLNEEQEQKLKVLYLKRIEERKELMEERREARKELMEKRKEQRQEMMEMNQQQKDELRGILNEEQFSKWEQLQEKRRKGRKGHREKGKN
jgi:periplasmic protein CpxP/Spy